MFLPGAAAVFHPKKGGTFRLSCLKCRGGLLPISNRSARTLYGLISCSPSLLHKLFFSVKPHNLASLLVSKSAVSLHFIGLHWVFLCKLNITKMPKRNHAFELMLIHFGASLTCIRGLHFLTGVWRRGWGGVKKMKRNFHYIYRIFIIVCLRELLLNGAM